MSILHIRGLNKSKIYIIACYIFWLTADNVQFSSATDDIECIQYCMSKYGSLNKLIDALSLNALLRSPSNLRKRFNNMCGLHKQYAYCLASCPRGPMRDFINWGLASPRFLCQHELQEVVLEQLICWAGHKAQIDRQCNEERLNVATAVYGTQTISQLKHLCSSIFRFESCQRQEVDRACGQRSAAFMWELQSVMHHAMHRVLQALPNREAGELPHECNQTLSQDRYKLASSFLSILIFSCFGYLFFTWKLQREMIIVQNDKEQPNFTISPEKQETFINSYQHQTLSIARSLCQDLDELNLHGRLSMELTKVVAGSINLTDVENSFQNIQRGHWAPSDCVARHRIALLVPFRNRHFHLTIWLAHILPVLQRQKLDFYIIVAEQINYGRFNKGRLFNAAFTYSQSFNVRCVILHDVDMFPEDDRLSYGCRDKPMHLGAYVDTLNYALLENDRMVGGVFVISSVDYQKANGFSNEYWGWGGEDNDMALRLFQSNLTIVRPNRLHGRYTMMPHKSRSVNESFSQRWAYLASANHRMHFDGLRQQVWTVATVTVRQLFHHLSINVNDPFDEVTIKTSRREANDSLTHS